MTRNTRDYNGSPSFDMRDHLDKLTPSKDKGKYICPICGDDNLGINGNTGAYQCFSTGCDTKAIREAIAPSDTKQWKQQQLRQNKPKSTKEKDKAVQGETLAIQVKVDELFWMVEGRSLTPGEARVELTAWCKQHGHNTYSVTQLLTEKLKALRELRGGNEEEKPRIMKEYETIRNKFGDRLRYNTLFNQVELDGQRLDPAIAKLELIIDHGMNLKNARDEVADSVLKIAKENQYNPVEEYLLTCYQIHGPNGEYLEGFAERTLMARDPIHNILVTKFLVSAVARIFEPGCKVDTALILQGAQGYGKSSFFQILASPEWFDDSFGNSSDKDERLKLHSAWILEWAELETVFRRKDVSAVKAFITTKIDRIRPPYGRSIEFLPRRSVFCGSTNEPEFLSDPTGNRRFWIVPMGKRLDFAALEQDRDRIWAAAVSLYRSGYRWELTRAEEEEAKEIARQYEDTDSWHDEVADWLDCRNRCSIQEILSDVLRIELHSHSKREQLRVRAILTRLNWHQVRNPVFYKGKRVRIWESPEVFSSDSTVSECQEG